MIALWMTACLVSGPSSEGEDPADEPMATGLFNDPTYHWMNPPDPTTWCVDPEVIQCTSTFEWPTLHCSGRYVAEIHTDVPLESIRVYRVVHHDGWPSTYGPMGLSADGRVEFPIVQPPDGFLTDRIIAYTPQLACAMCEARYEGSEWWIPNPDYDDDGDGFPYEHDCDDCDPSVHPDAPEIPGDGIDNDCDREVDEPA